MRVGMRALVSFGAAASSIAGCHSKPASTSSPPPAASIAPATSGAGAGARMNHAACAVSAGETSFSVSELEKTKRRPILYEMAANAWTGSAEGLPAVTVYEDGYVVTVARGDAGASVVEEGYVENAKALACEIAGKLTGLPRRTDLSKATDQPETEIAVRVGDVWHAVSMVGEIRGRTDDLFSSRPAPPSFLEVDTRLHSLPLAKRSAFPREDFIVTLHDDSVPSRPAAPWPSGVPAPPRLVPDTRWVGNPRSYHTNGVDGAKLRAFASTLANRSVSLPDGSRITMLVRVAIPDQDYIERVKRCSYVQSSEHHVCEKE